MRARLVPLLVLSIACGDAAGSGSEGDGARAPSVPPRGAPRKVAEPDTPTSATVPLHVTVSNQSLEIDPVDIDVYVDDKLVLTGDYSVHDGRSFELAIPRGRHTLRAVTGLGRSDHTEAFSVHGERWALVRFFFESDRTSGPRLSVLVLEEEPPLP